MYVKAFIVVYCTFRKIFLRLELWILRKVR